MIWIIGWYCIEVYGILIFWSNFKFVSFWFNIMRESVNMFVLVCKFFSCILVVYCIMKIYWCVNIGFFVFNYKDWCFVISCINSK